MKDRINYHREKSEPRKNPRTNLTSAKIDFRNDHVARCNASDIKQIFNRDDERLIRERLLPTPSEDSLRDARHIDTALKLAHLAFQFDLYIENATDDVISVYDENKYGFIDISKHVNATFNRFGMSHEELYDIYGQIAGIKHDLKLKERMNPAFVENMEVRVVANLLDAKKLVIK